MKKVHKSPKDNTIANGIIKPLIDDHEILKGKIKLAHRKFEEIKDEIAPEDRKNFLKYLIQQIKIYHQNPLLEEMEEYQKTTFTENISFELNIPSGKIVISSDMDEIFPPSKEIEIRENEWHMILQNHRTKYYAQNNTAYVPLGDIFPHVIIRGKSAVLFDHLPLPDDENLSEEDLFEYENYNKKSLTDEEILTGYRLTKSSMHIADYDEWVKAGGDETELLRGEGIWDAEEYDSVLIEIPAGRYQFTSYSSNGNFWKNEEAIWNSRGSVAKMEIIEAY